ncbi:MAG: transposase, partial [Bacteroidales bacterium]|nr:transposase [Bacteroidales bacterium]
MFAYYMPSLKKDIKLPVILNREELKELFAAPTLLKQRVVLALIYSAGLRGQEVINLKISDIDFERKTIHIRQSKYKKDRVVRYSYNSCGDRHCPKCQAAKQALWIDDLLRSTLPVRHYHLVFTVPHVLNPLCLHNDRLYYNLLFDAVWNTLRSFGYTHYGAETGALCVLHTWGQNLSLHPHIHCIVPAAGYTLDGTWKSIGHSGLFLYPVQQLSQAFKAALLDRIKRALRKRNETTAFYAILQQA